MDRITGPWTEEKTSEGISYWMCSCGYVSWDGNKCLKGHEYGYQYKPRQRKKKYSGFSNFRQKGQYQ